MLYKTRLLPFPPSPLDITMKPICTTSNIIPFMKQQSNQSNLALRERILKETEAKTISFSQAVTTDDF